ncbi:MAG: Gfo/Idh/MocA family oxidoreductase [Bacillus sp. (in: Bacteria)]|nr:Gfo/Idh/MocA family oxidoreductase [Bacillus sp. (in: firmicutes)]
MLNVGIVGIGWFSGVHAKIISEMNGVHIKAFCGTNKLRAEAYAAQFNQATGYGDIVEMLDSEKLNAVYICVPPFAHGEIERHLIERGIPFLVEKPLSTDLVTPQQILAKIQKNKLITSVGYHFRYRDSVSRLKNELEETTLGMVTGGWMGSMPPVSWWRNEAKSGGQFIEQTTHLVDLLRYTAGEVEEVYAVFGNRIMNKKYDGVTVPDIGSVTLKMKSGVIANLSNTCILPNNEFKMGLDFFHDKGILHINQDGLEKRIQGVKTGWSDMVNPYIKENVAFIDAVRTGDTSSILSDYQDAYRTQEITVAAMKSAKMGKLLKLKDF